MAEQQRAPNSTPHKASQSAQTERSTSRDTANQRIRGVLNGQISTFAGNGTAGFAGDTGPALAAEFNSPTALAIDATGALLVCDSLNHRVRRIGSGTITTIAGNGIQGFAGDGAAASAAELDTPSGVAASFDGHIYIADSHNDRIRLLALDGTISTVAGNGNRGFSGDGSAATAATLALPRGLMVTSAGALLFADSNNQRVRMVDALGIITTIVGSGVQGSSSDGNAAATAALDTPRTVAVSAFGLPVFADARNGLVRESAGNDNLYVPAGLAPSRTSTVSLSVPSTASYGGLSAKVSVSGVAGTPQGTVQLLDGTTSVAQTTLASGAASLSSASLSVGTHTLSATFLGDGVNPAAASVATHDQCWGSDGHCDGERSDHRVWSGNPRADRLAKGRVAAGQRRRNGTLHYECWCALAAGLLSHICDARRFSEWQLHA